MEKLRSFWSKDYREIGFACGIGALMAVIFGLIQFWLAPIVGSCAGFLAWRFREVPKKISEALEEAKIISRKSIKAARGFYKKYHPILNISILIILTSSALLIPNLSSYNNMFENCFVVLSLVLFAWLVFMSFILGGMLYEENILKHKISSDVSEWNSYRLVVAFFIQGVCISIYFFLWPLWKYLAIGIWKGFKFLGILYQKLYGQERLYCGMISLIFGTPLAFVAKFLATTSLEKTAIAVGGYLVGYVFGIGIRHVTAQYMPKVVKVKA